MKLPTKVLACLRDQMLARTINRRDPDFVIGGWDSPYLLRWFVIPRNGAGNAYIHEFRRSDDDRALHDHPWCNLSVLLEGEYTEHTIDAGGIHRRRIRRAGEVVLRSAKHAHRIELHDGPCRTLFITGPRIRQWGFHCDKAGWIPWQQFVDQRDSGDIGKGCDQ